MNNLALREAHKSQVAQPIKILKGPRQVGKTSLLSRLPNYQILRFDDHVLRIRANENPSVFLDQFTGPLILDEATHAPALFLELKKRVDENKQKQRDNARPSTALDIWITVSNQTFLNKNIQDSLAGRASYFDLNTLSIHEVGEFNLKTWMLKGGWPELHADGQVLPVQYLNDLISTFIEKDIVIAAGIEKRAEFLKMIALTAGRIGQLYVFSDIAKNIGVEVSTVSFWLSQVELNGLVRIIQPYSTNLNQRLIKAPKVYFEDVGLAARFQGWTEFEPLYTSSQFGHLVENLALCEVVRFFTNRGDKPQIYYLRSKEKIEIDFLIQLSNHRWVACEVKTTPSEFTSEQNKLLKTLQLNVIEKWILTVTNTNINFADTKIIHFSKIFDHLKRLV